MKCVRLCYQSKCSNFLGFAGCKINPKTSEDGNCLSFLSKDFPNMKSLAEPVKRESTIDLIIEGLTEICSSSAAGRDYMKMLKIYLAKDKPIKMSIDGIEDRFMSMFRERPTSDNSRWVTYKQAYIDMDLIKDGE